MGHTILDKGQFQTGSSQVLPMAPTQRCDRHGHKHIDMYCQNHDVVGCSTCMAVDHRLCNDMFYIPDFIQNNTSTVTHKDIQLELEVIAKNLTEQNDNLHGEKRRLLARKSELLDNIRSLRIEINDRLDELEKKSVGEIEDAFKSLVGALDDGMRRLQTHKARISPVKDRLASSTTNVSEVFVNVKIGGNVSSNAVKCIEDNKMKIRMGDIDFTTDRKILAFLEEVDALGTVTEKRNKTDECENEPKDQLKSLVCKIDDGVKQLHTDNASVTSAKQELASTSVSASNVFVKMGENNYQKAECIEDNSIQARYFIEGKSAYRFHEVNAIDKVTENNNQTVTDRHFVKDPRHNVFRGNIGSKGYIKAKSDRKTCDVVSICILEDGKIILSDASNMKLKHVDDSSYTVINECELPTPPWQVCSINKQQVAVTLPAKQEVRFISLGSKLETVSKIITDFKCYGLAYENGNLCISDKASSVFIYTVAGKKLKQFSKDKSRLAQFPCIRSLAVSKDASKIYVTDFNNGLTILNHDGKVVSLFDDPHLQGAYGCCLTETGSVLVCGRSSKNVLEFGPDGWLMGDVMEFDKCDVCPQAICCNQQTTKMIISKNHNDFIEEYEITREHPALYRSYSFSHNAKKAWQIPYIHCIQNEHSFNYI